MAAIDDKINALSSDELDLLNSDPKLLSDFKAKYSSDSTTQNPSASSPSTLGNIANKVMDFGNQRVANVASDAIGMVQGGYQAGKTALMDTAHLAQGEAMLPSEIGGSLLKGQMPDLGNTTLGKAGQEIGGQIKDSISGLAQGAKDFISHPYQSTVENHPIQTALFLQGLMPEDAPAGVESGAKGFAETLKDNADSKLAKLNKSLANVNENATKMNGMNQPIPTEAELTKGTQNVIDAAKGIEQEHGALLNKAKSEAGLPVTPEEKSSSIRKYGNQFNLNLNKPLELPEEAIGQTKSYEGPSILDKYGATNHLKNQLEKFATVYRDDPEIGKAYINKTIDEATNPSPNAVGATFRSQEIADQFKKELISKLDQGEGASKFIMSDPKPEAPMPYKITPTKTPEELTTEINRFLSNKDYIHPTDQVKAASYYQDKINSMVDWNKQQGDMEGILKTQHTDLKQLIGEASPQLQEAKTKWADLQNNLDEIHSHIDPENPGKTRAYLQRLFTSNSPASQKALSQLAYLEKITGTPVVTNLFKQFAGKAFESWASRPGREMLELAGGIGSAVLGHPTGAVAAGGLLAAQSPRLLGALESGASKLSKYHPQGFPMSAASLSQLQSIKDRLHNNESKQ